MFGRPLIAGAIAAFVLGLALSARAASNTDYLPLGLDPSEPQLLVTVEYMTYDELMQPHVIEFLKKHNIMVAPVIRANRLDDGLDELYRTYTENGVRIVFWPMLPREHCQYLNEQYADEYLGHLDNIYAWADKHGHRIEALIVDIEPPNCQSGTDQGPDPLGEGESNVDLGSLFDLLGKEEFEASFPKFQAVLDKLHEHGTVAISTAMDYAAVDIETGRPVLQDISGGPSQLIDWDYFTYMNFGSQNTAALKELVGKLGMKWTVEDTRYLSYMLCKIIVEEHGSERVAISLGQTIPGEGHGAVWEDPAELGKDAAACKSAGVIHFGIYDFQGIIESEDPDAWIEAVRNTPPKVPEKSRRAMFVYRVIKFLSWYLEQKR